MMKNFYRAIVAGLSMIVLGCEQSPDKPEQLFTLLPGTSTGIEFANNLEYDQKFNIYKYRNFYNGGGVGIGDFNNDGWADVYFTSNMGENKLYLNKGDFTFEDITNQAGVKGDKGWSTGVAVADVNGDGWLDIYVCNSGDIEGDNKRNELFINNGDLTFTESAASYGLDDSGYSTHGAFFDYDQDGDLDLYLLNNSYQAIGSFNLMKNERPKRDSVGGDKLFRNDAGRFTDVSEAANIYGSIIGFGLGVTIGDVNNDGWLDIYVSNDFFERDYLYINQQDGTFEETLEQEMQSISAASMGADMGDINNDGQSDIFVTEMLPEPDARLKTVTTFESWDRYQYSLSNGYYHQFTRNMLQLNNGNSSFSEIGRLSGVHATDWSWGALINDFDNDGFSDIYIANGIYQDLTDQDYLQFVSNEETMKAIITESGVDYKKLIDVIPSVRIPNYAFKNNGDLTFTNMAESWGLATPSHSNGSAYADFDNDGDLDLVVNNVNMPSFVYRNESDTTSNRFLKVKLTGEGKNPFALGTKVRVYANGEQQIREHVPTRGFQSSMDYTLHFGLGKTEEVDSLVITWPNGLQSKEYGIKANHTLTASIRDAKPNEHSPSEKESLFSTSDRTVDFTHVENDYVDFDRERLIFQMLSTEGPAAAKGDLNGDGRMDLFVGGASGQSASILLQSTDGAFQTILSPAMEQDKLSEDVDCVLFDADNDGDLDIYVASGGSEFTNTSAALADRLYFNDGTGNFTKTAQTYPTIKFESSSTVEAGDFDGDGDNDLFVGIRLQPMLYGVPVNGYILENDGSGSFANVTDEIAPELRAIGMITDAEWSDTDLDGDVDLVVVGEYMPLTLFENQDGSLVKKSMAANSSGWWNVIQPADLDGDGDIDFVVGNHGKNSRFKASKEKPLEMFINDFDGNGTVEQIISTYNGGQSYPLVLKHDLVRQMPGLKKKYLKYESFKEQTINDIFTAEQMEKAVHLSVETLATSILINQGNNEFQLVELPVEAQISPVYGILVQDFDHDGTNDILLGGNLYNVKPEMGRYDASHGVLLKGGPNHSYSALSASEFGERISGQVRHFLPFENDVIVIKNNDQSQIISYK